MEKLKRTAISLVQADNNEVDNTHRAEIVQKIETAQNRKEIGFVLLDYNLPRLFAKCFSYYNDGKTIFFNWSNTIMRSLIALAKKKLDPCSPILNSFHENIAAAGIDVNSFDPKTINSEEDAVQLLAKILGTSTEKLSETSEDEMHEFRDFLSSIYGTMVFAIAELDLTQKHHKEMADIIKEEWSKHD